MYMDLAWHSESRMSLTGLLLEGNVPPGCSGLVG